MIILGLPKQLQLVLIAEFQPWNLPDLKSSLNHSSTLPAFPFTLYKNVKEIYLSV